MFKKMSATARGRIALAADAGLLTAGLFSVFTSIMYLLQIAKIMPVLGTPGKAMVLQVIGALVTMFGPLLGVVIVWKLYKRPASKWTVLGAFLGYFVSGAVLMVGTLLAQLFGLIVSPFTDSEFAGPLIFLALLVLAVIIAILVLVVDAMRDLMAETRRHAAIDLVRLVSAAVLLSLAVFLVQFTLAHPRGEMGEAGIFAIAAGLGAAALTATADWVTTYQAQRESQGGA